MEEIKVGTEVIVHVPRASHIDGKRGVVVKVLDPPLVEEPHKYHYLPDEAIRADGLVEYCFIVDFPSVKSYMFNAYHDRFIPSKEKKWTHLPQVCVTIAPILSDVEMAEIVAEGLRAYSSSFLIPEKDGTCIVTGCSKVATTIAGVNVLGRGYVFKSCDAHAKEYGNRWADGLGFVPKQTVKEESKVTES